MSADLSCAPAKSCRCSRCGVESPLVEFFKTERAPFHRKPQTFCPRCRSALKLKQRWLLLLASLLFLPPVLFTLTQPGGRDEGLYFLANLYLTLWLQLLLTPLHELGHAIPARIVGLKIWRIIIGQGPLLQDFNLFGFRWFFRVLPVGGVTVATRLDNQFSRRAHFIFVLGGPLANVVLALVLWALILPDSPWNLYPLFHSLALLQVLFWANLIFLIGNLYPRNVNSVLGHRIGTDGRQLLNILLYRLSSRAALLDRLNLRGANEALLTGEYAYGFRLLDFIKEESYAKQVENLRRLLLLYSGRLDEALAAHRVYLQRADLSPIETAIARNNVAYVSTLIGNPADLPEADQLSQSALADLPWANYAIGTRGTVLLALGRYAEAEKLLRASLADIDSASNQAQSLALLAVAQAGQGHSDSARRLLAKARHASPQCFIFPVIEKKLAALSSPN